MTIRLLSATLLFTASTILAQGEVPPAKPKPASDVPKPVAQEKSSGEIISELRREKARLEREIEYAKQRAMNANKMLADKLRNRGQKFRSIDAGTNRPARPAAPEIKKAELISEAEPGQFDSSVMLVIDGLPVPQSEFDSMMAYMRSLSTSGDENVRAQRVLFELVRIYSVAAKFPENDAEGRISDVYAELQQGKTMAEVAKKYGTVVGADEEGTVTVTRNSYLGIKLEQTAFALKEGEYSKPFRSVYGFSVIGVNKIEKGATPEQDKITATAVQIGYTADGTTLTQAQAAASRGQSSILVRDQAVMDMLPPMYRPMGAQPPAGNQAQQIVKRLQAIDSQIKRLEAGDTGDASDTDVAAQLKALKQQRAALQATLDMSKAGDLIVPDKAPAPVQPAGVIKPEVIKKEVIKKGDAKLKPIKKK